MSFFIGGNNSKANIIFDKTKYFKTVSGILYFSHYIVLVKIPSFSHL